MISPRRDAGPVPRILVGFAMRLCRLLTILITLTLASEGAFSQQPAQSTYRFVLNVVDKHGAPVEDVHSSDLRIKIGKQSAIVAHATRYHAAPIRVVILLDESGSMQPVWATA